METTSKLAKQRATDAIAALLVVVLTLIIGLFASTLIAAAFINVYFPQTPHDDNPVQGIFMALAWMGCLILFSPLWLWAAIRLRRLLNWPKGAFRHVRK